MRFLQLSYLALTHFPPLLEKPQVRGRLALSHRHQQAVGAEEIDFLADGDIRIILVADELPPVRSWVRIAAQISRDGPRPCQSMIVDGDLVVQNGLVIG